MAAAPHPPTTPTPPRRAPSRTERRQRRPEVRRAGRAHSRSAPRCTRSAALPPRSTLRGSSWRFYEPGLWVSVQAEPDGFAVQCGRRSAVGQMRPPQATDDSDCCATPALHREMEAAPRVSAVPHRDWRRWRPRLSPGIPGQGGGAAPAPLSWEPCWGGRGINNPGCSEG